jgi:uncharacterized membrane protein YeaQ/YmgE (transglycosylase-associated protein family)
VDHENRDQQPRLAADNLQRRNLRERKDAAMTFSWDQVFVWMIVGLIAGSIVGLVVKGDRKGFGLFSNLLIGLAGAFVGGLLFRLFGLLPSLDQIAISLRDILSAVIGSLIVLAARWYWLRRSTGPAN